MRIRKEEEKLPIYFHLLLFHRYKTRSPVPFRGYGDIKSVNSQKRDAFPKLNLVKMYGKLTFFLCKYAGHHVFVL